MLIQFLDSVAGVTYSYRRRKQYQLPDEEAQRWIDAGVAVEVEPEFRQAIARHEPLEVPEVKRKRAKKGAE